MAKTPEQMAQTMLDNIPEKTGKTLAQWFSALAKTRLGKHGELVRHLKQDHGVTHGFANLIVHEFLKRQAPGPTSETDLVAQQYAGPKADLKPIYDTIIKAVSAFGADVEVAPKKTYVSLRRSKQFALVQPSTKTRVDVGINLKATRPGARLEASGSFNAMVSHRVRLTEKSDVDAELLAWLRKAYDAA